MALVVYFSSKSENTRRFVEKLGMPNLRIGVNMSDDLLEVNEPYVLICPTYGGGQPGGAVPKQVIHFLNNEKNRSYLIGVIGAGNTNFGEYYGAAGDVISQKCGVPMLCRFELSGTPEDVVKVQEGITKSWTQLCEKKRAA